MSDCQHKLLPLLTLYHFERDGFLFQTLARPFRAIRCERSEQRMCTFHGHRKALVSCPLCKGNQCFSILIVDEYTTHLTACQVVKFKPIRRDQNGTHGSSIAGERCNYD